MRSVDDILEGGSEGTYLYSTINFITRLRLCGSKEGNDFVLTYPVLVYTDKHIGLSQKKFICFIKVNSVRK
jgi:hypothetical protein